MDVEVAKRTVTRFLKWEYSWLSLIIVATLALHLMVVARPNEPLFDEIYYVKDARVILQQHITERTEHPPLGKLAIAGGILVIGDSPVGWRIPSILFGTAGVVFLYLTCRNLKMSRRGSSLAAFILATENLYFVHTGIAMLDIFTVSFMLLSFWLYTRRSYPLSMVGGALSALAKLTGVFSGFVIVIHWLIGRRDRRIHFAAGLILAPLSFMLLYAAFEAAIWHRLIDFINSIEYMLTQTGSLTFVTAAHVSMSRPWEWIFNLEIMPYWYGPHYIGLVSFSVWALIVPLMVYMTYKAIFKKNTAALFVIAWFIGTWFIWVPLDIVTDRVTFIFYFLPTVPAFCLGLGMVFDEMIGYWQRHKKAKLKVAPAIAPPEPPAQIDESLSENIQAEVMHETGTPASDSSPTPLPEPPPPVPSAEIPIPLAVAKPAPPAVTTETPPVEAPHRWYRKGKLQWAAISFVFLFFAVHIATFIIVAPPLNNWHIENWFK